VGSAHGEAGAAFTAAARAGNRKLGTCDQSPRRMCGDVEVLDPVEETFPVPSGHQDLVL
jgi:hypothetical protein